MWIYSAIKDPIVLYAPTRQHIGVFGAVRVADGTLVSERASTFNALTRLFKKIRKMKEVEEMSEGLWEYLRRIIPWKEIKEDWNRGN